MKRLGILLAAVLLGGCASFGVEPGKAEMSAKEAQYLDQIHLSGPNWKWEPEFRHEAQEGQRTHLIVLNPEQIENICGGFFIIACTVPWASEATVKEINQNIYDRGGNADHLLEVGSCVIFMPPRDPDFPRLWFYLLGHEFSHCRYGQFHPSDVPEDYGDDV